MRTLNTVFGPGARWASRILLLVLCALVSSAVRNVTVASPGESRTRPVVRIVFPNADTIVYGTMPVRVETRSDLPYRIVEPMPEGRCLVLFDSRQSAVAEHTWLRDFKPHRLLAQVWEKDQWSDVPGSELWTAGFPRPDAWAQATARGPSFADIEIGSHPALEEVVAHLETTRPEALFDCAVGGRDCRVTRVERIREGGALYVTFLVDNSTSMRRWSHPWQIAQSIDALLTAMKRQPFETRVRLAVFAKHSTDITTGYLDDPDALRVAAGNISFGDNTSVGTNVYAAIDRELRRIAVRRETTTLRDRPAQFAMMVWTDGKSTRGDVEEYESRVATLISRAKAPIFPIMVGSSPGTLKSLASASGGRCFDAGTMDTEKVFGEEIAEFLSTRYRIRIELPKERRSGSLTLKVRERSDVRLFHQDALTEGPKILDTAEQVLARSLDFDELENAALIVGRETTVEAGKRLRSALARLIAWNVSLAACFESGSSGTGSIEWKAGLSGTCGQAPGVANLLEKNVKKCERLFGPLVSASALEGCLGPMDAWALERARTGDPPYAAGYERFRTAVLASIEEMTGRALLWEADARLQRDWLEFLDGMIAEGFPLCPVVRPFLRLAAWPGFPSEPDVKAKAEAMCVGSGTPVPVETDGADLR